MRRKVGSKIKIRTWDDMYNQYGLTTTGAIKTPLVIFHPVMEAKMPEDRVLTITDVYDNYYNCAELPTWGVTEKMIERKRLL